MFLGETKDASTVWLNSRLGVISGSKIPAYQTEEIEIRAELARREKKGK
jgi:hypothetical protein